MHVPPASTPAQPLQAQPSLPAAQARSLPFPLALILTLAVGAFAPARAATTYTDSATQTTLVNGSTTIVYNKSTGLATYSLGGTARLRNFFS